MLQIVDEITWRSVVMIHYMAGNVYEHAIINNVTRTLTLEIYISQVKGISLAY